MGGPNLRVKQDCNTAEKKGGNHLPSTGTNYGVLVYVVRTELCDAVA